MLVLALQLTWGMVRPLPLARHPLLPLPLPVPLFLPLTLDLLVQSNPGSHVTHILSDICCFRRGRSAVSLNHLLTLACFSPVALQGATAMLKPRSSAPSPGKAPPVAPPARNRHLFLTDFPWSRISARRLRSKVAGLFPWPAPPGIEHLDSHRHTRLCLLIH